jgi:hypothetical protein
MERLSGAGGLNALGGPKSAAYAVPVVADPVAAASPKASSAAAVLAGGSETGESGSDAGESDRS